LSSVGFEFGQSSHGYQEIHAFSLLQQVTPELQNFPPFSSTLHFVYLQTRYERKMPYSWQKVEQMS